MSVNGVGLKFYQNDVATTKSTKNVTSTEKAANINASQKNESTASSSKQVAPDCSDCGGSVADSGQKGL